MRYAPSVSWTIRLQGQVTRWVEGLRGVDADYVAAALDVLESVGPLEARGRFLAEEAMDARRVVHLVYACKAQSAIVILHGALSKMPLDGRDRGECEVIFRCVDSGNDDSAGTDLTLSSRSLPRGLLGLAVRLLPPAHRTRYAREFRAELAELPRRERLQYTLQILFGILSLRRVLRERTANELARSSNRVRHR
jgi:hypothetical protein